MKPLSFETTVVSFFFSLSFSPQHNNGAVMRELTALKQQMASLQQMMRLQMEMQADVQRAIRQEISAAINAPTDDKSCAGEDESGMNNLRMSF